MGVAPEVASLWPLEDSPIWSAQGSAHMTIKSERAEIAGLESTVAVDERNECAAHLDPEGKALFLKEIVAARAT